MKIQLNFTLLIPKSNYHSFYKQLILAYENRITLQFHIIHFDFTTFTKVKIKLWQHRMVFYKCLKDKATNIENKPIFISLS